MDMQQLTKISLAWELYQSGIPLTHIASDLSVHRETVGIWIREIQRREDNLLLFLDDYSNAKKGPRSKRKLDGLIKAMIYRLRNDYADICGQKISYFLHKETGIYLSSKTIYKVLNERYQLRSKWKKNTLRGPVPKAAKPREVIQMDSVNFGEVFAFTSVDICTREVTVGLYPNCSSISGEDFLHTSFTTKYHHVELLQADGGSEFKDQFKKNVFTYCNRFRIARPYRKNEQSYIESFNRTLRKECLGWRQYKPSDMKQLQQELDSYLTYYHTVRPHLSLHMKTPQTILSEYY